MSVIVWLRHVKMALSQIVETYHKYMYVCQKKILKFLM